MKPPSSMLIFFFGDGVWILFTKNYQFLHFCLSTTFIITAIAGLEAPSEKAILISLSSMHHQLIKKIVIPYADHILYKCGQNDDD